MENEQRFAILIDGDNISAEYISTILDEISNKGVATYKRVYGDWTKPYLSKWKDILLKYSITPMQQYSYTVGKNATDCAMIIDAMDILYTGNVEGFCLATSDSDFTKLASRLRESGMKVIGMGEEKTPRPFVAACDEFKFIDKIAKEASKSYSSAKNYVDKRKPHSKSVAQTSSDETSQTDLNTIKSTIMALIKDNSDDDGYMLVSDIGIILPKRHADFDVRNFGYTKMVKFLESLDEFEIKKINDPENKKRPNAQIAYIKIK